MSTKINQEDYAGPRSNHYDQHFQKIQAYFIIFIENLKTVIEDCRKSKTTNYSMIVSSKTPDYKPNNFTPLHRQCHKCNPWYSGHPPSYQSGSLLFHSLLGYLS